MPHEGYRIDVRPISLEAWPEAARLLAQARGDFDAAAAGILEDCWWKNPEAAKHLLGGFSQGQLKAVLWIEPLAAGASVWPPRISSQCEPELLIGLFEAAMHRLQIEGWPWAQLIVRNPSPAETELYRNFGFRNLGDLEYMCLCVEHCNFSLDRSPVVFQPFRPELHDRLVCVIEATYEGTCDYPELNEVRRVEDDLKAYLSVGTSSDSLWRLIVYEGNDAGCLLLADHPQHDNIELVYMGIVPGFRGRGFGRLAVEHACKTARALARRHVVLAVAARNRPAINVYRAAGFQSLDVRTVFYWLCDDRRARR